MQALPANVIRLGEILGNCRLCPRRCGVDRTSGRLGACGIGAKAIVASAGPHFGEEPCLVGRGGSGTIFLAGCNLHCVFCQNHDISHSNSGWEVSGRQIGQLALGLQQQGCENVNFVTPTHVAHAVGEAIVLAREGGLSVPIVYNCGGYELVEILRLLEGLVEVYMPDFKYADAEAGLKYSGVADYPAVATAAVTEMYRQVGPLRLDGRGGAEGGLLVRHLVMPGDIADSRQVIGTLAAKAPGCGVNIMGQYHPAHRAAEFGELLARVEVKEIDSLRDYARACGLVRVD